MSESPELYLRYRPQKPSEVYGQDAVIATVSGFLRDKRVPHFLLLTGPSGTGKTTVARMLAKALGCPTDSSDYQEINASEERGIDTARSIIGSMAMSPLFSKCRVFVLDECQSLTSQAQEALLKPTEDAPPTSYFFFCTTDPHKLKGTIKTRATFLEFVALQEPDIRRLVRDVSAKESLVLTDAVINKIAASSNGSARAALVKLHAIAGIKDESAQLAAITCHTDEDSTGFQLARELYKSKIDWKAVVKILKQLKETGEEPETTRRIVMGYGRTILLNDYNSHALMVMEEFRANYYDTADAGLMISCANVFAESMR